MGTGDPIQEAEWTRLFEHLQSNRGLVYLNKQSSPSDPESSAASPASASTEKASDQKQPYRKKQFGGNKEELDNEIVWY